MTDRPGHARVAEAAGLLLTAMVADVSELPRAVQDGFLVGLVVGARGSRFESDDPVQVIRLISDRVADIIHGRDTLQPQSWAERQQVKLYLRFLAIASSLVGKRTSAAAKHLINVCKEEMDL